ncbi:WD repeat-containing protein 93-like isoform X2 [Gigantopelta aegis]|uniref:WD repeat-containing protein 93-like isoform X2 n=1 Tax=Gigantopelta aegis TaxID=1735272 RepID=UPI001B889965|nr:WD repeat-containing protein 93-like isoform X2 [Gigantopelta aegis]
MPVYVRKNVFTPPSIDNVSSEDEDDYLQDPELLRDDLPQPYRMIDKILSMVLDTVWDIISIKERYRLAQESKIRPPRYDSAQEMQPAFSKVTEMTNSVDGRYIFVGLPNSLTVMDAMTQRIVTSWEEDQLEITQIKAHIMGVQTYLIVTVDDMGIARLFAFAFDCLFLLKILNEPDGGTKILASKCEASIEGDYVGIVVENPSTKETWLDIHKTPRDAWLRELDVIQAQIAPKEETGGDKTQTETSMYNREPQDKPEKKKKKQKRKEQSPEPVTRPVTPPTLTDLSSYKFTSPTLVVKIRPTPPITGCSCTLSVACNKVDQGEVIGSGQNHIVTPQHFALRDKMFDHLHENVLQYIPPKDPLAAENIVMPNFHFLTAGRMVSPGLEQTTQAAQPTTVAVWWDGGSHIMHYSLIKGGKDIEHKADLVWPFTCNIKCSATTLCDTFIAVGLDNGTVSLWDWHIGVDVGIISVSTETSIERLRFLDPTICADEQRSYPPYKTRVSTCLVIQCKNGAQYLHNTAAGSTIAPLCISEEPENEDEYETILQTMTDVPEVLLVVEKSGHLLLKDVTTGFKLCQLCLPITYKLASPWQPVFAFGGGGQFVYVKGELLYEDSEPEADTNSADQEASEQTETDAQNVASDQKVASDPKIASDQKVGIKQKVASDLKVASDQKIASDQNVASEQNVASDQKTASDQNVASEQEEVKAAGVCMSQMFFFPLRSFPTLDKYWERRRTPVDLRVHSTVENRLQALMEARWEEQALRKCRMQMRWKMLRDELELVNLRRDMTNKSLSQTFYTESTYRTSPPIF